MATLALVHRLTEPLGVVDALSWSPDGRQLAVLAGGVGRLWDATTGRAGVTLHRPGFALRRIAWSPRGDLIATTGLSTVLLWDPKTGRYGAQLGQGVATDFGWSASGHRIAQAGEHRLEVWDAAARRVVNTPASLPREARLSWSSDQRHIATNGHPTSVLIWDASTGERVRSLRGHRRPVIMLSWNGERLLTASEDRSVRLWDPDRGELVARLTGAAAPITAVGWSVAGDRVAAGCADGAVLVWSASTGEGSASTGEGSASTGEPLVSVAGSGVQVTAGRVTALTLGPRELIVATEAQVVRVLDAHTGASRQVLTDAAQAIWTPAGDRLATAGGSTVMIWHWA